MKCLIADDDKMCRLSLERLCKQVEDLEIVAICENGLEALNVLQKEEIDVIFLDIEMPNLTGMDMVRNLTELPQVIFTTGAPEYALEAFEYNVTDYLVKPIEQGRFLKAVQKARVNMESSKDEIHTDEVNELFLRVDGKLVNVQMDEILWIEALGDYAMFYTKGKRYTVHTTMKNLESRLPKSRFQKVHRSFIIQISKIKDIQDNTILIEDKVIPISRGNRDALMGKLNML